MTEYLESIIRRNLQNTAHTKTFWIHQQKVAQSTTKRGGNDRNVKFIFVNLNIIVYIKVVLSASFSTMSQSNTVLVNLYMWLLFRNG